MGEVVIARRRERHGLRLIGGVLPIPAVYTAERRGQRAGGHRHPVLLLVRLRITPWSAVGLGVEFGVHRCRRRPRIEQVLALLQPVLVLEPFARLDLEGHALLMERSLLRREERCTAAGI